jgi:hypothetical protein
MLRAQVRPGGTDNLHHPAHIRNTFSLSNMDLGEMDKLQASPRSNFKNDMREWSQSLRSKHLPKGAGNCNDNSKADAGEPVCKNGKGSPRGSIEMEEPQHHTYIPRDQQNVYGGNNIF